jgi:hypothetical protein
MPGSPVERLSQVWDLTQEAWSVFQGAQLNKDYREMLQCLLEEKVRFLLVGAYALAVHGFPRATKDIFLEGLEIPVISVSDLIANKRASGRSQDLVDVERLESALKPE